MAAVTLSVIGVDVVVGVVAVAEILDVADVPTSFTRRHAVIEVEGARVGHAVAVGEAGNRAERHVRDRGGEVDRAVAGGLSVTLVTWPAASRA